MVRKDATMARTTIIPSRAIEFLPIGSDGKQFVFTMFTDGRADGVAVYEREFVWKIAYADDPFLNKILTEIVDLDEEGLKKFRTAAKTALFGPKSVSQDRRELTEDEIDEFLQIANATDRQYLTWRSDPPKGYSWTEHKLSFPDTLVVANNLMKISMPDDKHVLLVVSREVANVVECLPGYDPRKGRLNDKWEVHTSDHLMKKNFLVVCEEIEDAVIGVMVGDF
jgi:hypothetical protein